MGNDGQFFYDGVEIGYVKGFKWGRKGESETIDIYKSPSNEGSINVGGIGKQYDISIDAVEYNPQMAEALDNAVEAITEGGSTAPLVIMLKHKTLTFVNAHNGGWDEDGGDPSKPIMLGLSFTATLSKREYN